MLIYRISITNEIGIKANKKTRNEENMKRLLIINNEKPTDGLGWIPVIKEAILKIEEVEFIIINHSEITSEKLNEINPDLIYLTGRVKATSGWTIDEILEDYSAELEMLRNIEIPTLGVCAGHQLIGIAHGSDFGKIVETADGEEDIRELGFQEIELIKSSPLFNKLDNKFVCYQYHRDEVKVVPNGFELLASNKMCKIQAMKHKERNLYGVQFHPEQYNKENTDGKTILSNFLDMANKK